MDRLYDIRVFVEVAKGRSFVAAALRLGMSRASVTKHVSALESMLGARLLNRSPQHISLTDAGMVVLSQGIQLLHEFDEMENQVRQSMGESRGILRVGAPVGFGTFYLVPAVAAFQEKNPGIEVV